MIIGVPKETREREKRVAITPEITRLLIKNGFDVMLEAGAGINSFYNDDAYAAEGASICSKDEVYAKSDTILKVNAPELAEIALMKKQSILICFMWAATNADLVEACVKQGISAFSMDAIPRISRAQKMDALSSQANIAGYKAVLMAVNTSGKIIPMMTTAAGTIRPSKFVIFGAGVAGLQAIATAKRLGGIVEVSDIRPDTKEQVESLGCKFIEVPGDNTIKIEGGYVRSVSDDFLKKQKETVARHVKDADIVITTALIPGKKAPVLVTEDMVKSMKFGSVILDMAVEQGGNVEGSEFNKTVQKHGVTIVGESNLASLLPLNASDLYSRNISTLLLHLATCDGFKWEMEEEITKGSLIVHNGVAVHPSVAKIATA